MPRPWGPIVGAGVLGLSVTGCGLVAGLGNSNASASDRGDATVDAAAPAEDGSQPGMDMPQIDGGSTRDAPSQGDADAGSDAGLDAMCAESGAPCGAVCCAPLVCHPDGKCDTCKSTAGADCNELADCCPTPTPLFCQKDYKCSTAVCVPLGSTGCTLPDNCCVGAYCLLGACIRCVRDNGICTGNEQCCSGTCKGVCMGG